MCDHAVTYDPSSLEFVPDWFVPKDWAYVWYDDYYANDDDKDKFIDDDDDDDDDNDEGKFFKWYYSYRAEKAQKASIKEELLSIAWHSSRWRDWCTSEDEKQGIETFWR